MNLESTKRGRIIRSYSDWFDVLVADKVIACQLRGKFRKIGRALTGDWVHITVHPDDTGVIEKIEARNNQLLRPPIANIDQAVVVASLAEPPLNLPLLDRCLLLVEHQGLDVVVCFNKIDLADPQLANDMVELYVTAGYRAVGTSTQGNVGVEKLRSYLEDTTSVLSGPSGVGKSSLLNAMRPGLRLVVAPVSSATGRGKHTTRKVELLQLSESALIADTPGFSRLDLDFLSKWEVPAYFREMADLTTKCRFQDCLHRQEPDCAVKVAVAQGVIAQSRYDNYLMIINECEEFERRKYT